MKKIIVAVVMAMMVAGLTACGDSSIDKTLSDKKYQEIMNDMGIQEWKV